VDEQRQRWLQFLAAEWRRRTEYRATHGNALEWLEAELDAMHERLVAGGTPWSPTGASMAERIAMFDRSPPDSAVEPAHEEAAIESWFREHGYLR